MPQSSPPNITAASSDKRPSKSGKTTEPLAKDQEHVKSGTESTDKGGKTNSKDPAPEVERGSSDAAPEIQESNDKNSTDGSADSLESGAPKTPATADTTARKDNSKSTAPDRTEQLKALLANLAVKAKSLSQTTYSASERLVSKAANFPVRATVISIFVASLIFVTFPTIDIYVAGLFYESGEGFPGVDRPMVQYVRSSGRVLLITLTLVFLFPLLAKIAWPQGRMLLSPRASLFVIGSLIIGPGLIVNGIFKELWGRARPRNLEIFGEEKVFSPAWYITDQCESNCSFVSGEAASVAWLLVVVFLVPASWRKQVLAVALVIVFLVSATRIIMGAHFLSDVVLAWGIVFLTILLLYDLIMVRMPASFDQSTEQSLARLGNRLRGK